MQIKLKRSDSSFHRIYAVSDIEFATRNQGVQTLVTASPLVPGTLTLIVSIATSTVRKPVLIPPIGRTHRRR